MRKCRLPIGVDNFEKLRDENLYYVDKTLLIKELLDSWSEVTLFTRPRRF
ncbi:MAG: AAA family ATPase, partial [Oscillospiraceae bacterium]|nr:AAA family ATPase [Oscillospiraceae bacterium]